eukprot:TRINITY_DN14520_c0_g1_i1.p2 TRINITY_DN14520_c0_g1~~TRINITY_DN14520_c0_g1_i1.p2  ORF type:complete len:176 (+),score=70.88 TRINITY_DN14520_c0_g1_i1:205-732(+)
MDLQGWGIMRGFDRKYTTMTSALSQAYYPDYMGLTIIVNYPWAVWGAWKVAEYVLDAHTLAKIKFMSKADATALLADLFEPEDLYERFGGKRKEVEPAGSEFDAEVTKWWQKTRKLPEAEREAEFERALQAFYDEECTEEEKAWWEAMRHSDGDPMAHPMPLRSSASSSSTTASS